MPLNLSAFGVKDESSSNLNLSAFGKTSPSIAPKTPFSPTGNISTPSFEMKTTTPAYIPPTATNNSAFRSPGVMENVSSVIPTGESASALKPGPEEVKKILSQKTFLTEQKTGLLERAINLLPDVVKTNVINPLKEGIFGTGQFITPSGQLTEDKGLLGFLLPGLTKTTTQKVFDRVDALTAKGIPEERATQLAVANTMPITPESYKASQALNITPEEAKILKSAGRWEGLADAIDIASVLPIGSISKLAGTAAAEKIARLSTVHEITPIIIKEYGKTASEAVDLAKKLVNVSDARVVEDIIKGTKIITPATEGLKIYEGGINTSAFKPETAPYTETGDLSTKILSKLEGKTTISKQFVSDLAKNAEIKQVEKDIINKVLETEGPTINAAAFASKVKSELLPISPNNRIETQAQKETALNNKGIFFEEDMSGEAVMTGKDGEPIEYDSLSARLKKMVDDYTSGSETASELQGHSKYESISLPSELKGNVANYKENIYESPIKTSAGGRHFAGTENYFGHTRVEDMADNNTRRIIEVQSDLYQKGNLENEIPGLNAGNSSLASKYLSPEDSNRLNKLAATRTQGMNLTPKMQQEFDSLLLKAKENRTLETSKLQQYTDPTAHFRMVREEIRKAAQDGKTKLQFPTGTTAMKIEGLGETNIWFTRPINHTRNEIDSFKINLDNLKIGQDIYQNGLERSKWIVTNIFENGQFKAMPENQFKEFTAGESFDSDRIQEELGGVDNPSNETFDISGKVDTNSPIYKFYENTLGKYLKSKYGAKLITDKQGVAWYEVNIKPEYGQKPVEAFSKSRFTKSQGGLMNQEEIRKIILDTIGENKVTIIFTDELINGFATGEFKRNGLGNVIKLYQESGKSSVVDALHESKHLLFSMLPEALRVQILAQARKEIGPVAMADLRATYKGIYKGNNEEALLEEYAVDKWARGKAEESYGYKQTLWDRFFDAFDQLMKQLSGYYDEIKAKFSQIMEEKGGAQKGSVGEKKKFTDFNEENIVKTPETENISVPEKPTGTFAQIVKEVNNAQAFSMLPADMQQKVIPYIDPNIVDEVFSESKKRLEKSFNEDQLEENYKDFKRIISDPRLQSAKRKEALLGGDYGGFLDTLKKLNITGIKKSFGATYPNEIKEIRKIENKVERTRKMMDLSRQYRQNPGKRFDFQYLFDGGEKDGLDYYSDVFDAFISRLTIENPRLVMGKRIANKLELYSPEQITNADKRKALETIFKKRYDIIQRHRFEEAAKARGEKIGEVAGRKEVRGTELAKRQELRAKKDAEIKAIIGNQKDRRAQVRAIQDALDLSSEDIKGIMGNRNITIMKPADFDNLLKELYGRGMQIEDTTIARQILKATIWEKEFRNVENLQKAMKFPPISEMSAEQLREFDKILQPFETGDTFLSKRKLELLDNTSLKGVRTIREARAKLAEKLNIPVSQLENIKMGEFDRVRWDTALAERNPFYKVMVEGFNSSILQGDMEFLKTEEDVNRLMKNARPTTGIKQKIGQIIAPTDEAIFDYMSAENKEQFRDKLTPEQLKVAEYMRAKFADALAYQYEQGILKKSRYEDNYITNIRRGFFEALKEGEIKKAFVEMFSQYKEDAAVLNILDQKTGEVLPLEKFFKFAMQRTGGINPTKNVAKAFLTYMKTFEKKKALDRIIPEIMAYVDVLTPQETTQGGLYKDDRLMSFVKEYLNNKKGRTAKMLVQPGGKTDFVIKSTKALTNMLDLMFNIPLQLASQGGVQAGVYTQMGAKKYFTGLGRFIEKGVHDIVGKSIYTAGLKRFVSGRGKEILKRYENFTGRNPWIQLLDASKGLPEKAHEAMFTLFRDATVRGNKIQLLGSMTEEEWKTGKISPARLASLQTEIGRWLPVEGAKSIAGSTTEGSAFTQYRTWALPILRTSVKDFTEIVKMLKNKKNPFNSKEFWELFRAAQTGALVSLIAMAIGYNPDKKVSEMNFTEKIINKSIQDSLSMLSALDIRTWAKSPRLVGFVTDLLTALGDLQHLEEYKSTGELKGTAELKRMFTPALARSLQSTESEKTGVKIPNINIPNINIPNIKLPNINIPNIKL